MNQLDVDVVVIGAGHQGLVSGAVLADLGYEVLVCESNPQIGGATRSGEITAPGLSHDLYATNMNLLLGSPFYAKYGDELSRHGLSFSASSTPYASAFPAGNSLIVSQDEETTRRMWAEHDSTDAAGWSRLQRVFDTLSATYLPLAAGALPSTGALGRTARALLVKDRASIEELMQASLSSTRALGERYFQTAEARSLVAAWGMHLDFAPDITGGAIFPILEMFLDQQFGMHVVTGGVSALPDALQAMISTRGGRVITGDPVNRIIVSAGRAVGVHTASGIRVRSRRGVIATTPLPMVVTLLGDSAPVKMRSAAQRYRFGPATLMVHLAVDGPIPWSDPRLGSASYVHLGPYVDDMARAYQQAMSGFLPDEPLLVVGQTSVVDPSRSGETGMHVVWIQARTYPWSVRGDSLGVLSGADWASLREPIGDRVIAKLERFAPGVTSRIQARAVITPADLAASNANLVHGDSLSGSHHLDQFVALRPSLRLSRYRNAGCCPLPRWCGHVARGRGQCRIGSAGGRVPGSRRQASLARAVPQAAAGLMKLDPNPTFGASCCMRDGQQIHGISSERASLQMSEPAPLLRTSPDRKDTD